MRRSNMTRIEENIRDLLHFVNAFVPDSRMETSPCTRILSFVKGGLIKGKQTGKTMGRLLDSCNVLVASYLRHARFY